MKINMIILLIILLLLSGCLREGKTDQTPISITGTQMPGQVFQTDKNIITTSLPLPTLTQAASAIPPESTAPYKSSPTTPILPTSHQETSTPESFDFRFLCRVGVDDPYPDNVLSGTIVLGGEDFVFQGQQYLHDVGQESVLLFWNTETDDKTSLSLAKMMTNYYSATSPNQQWLALTEGKTLQYDTNITILSGQGQEVRNTPLPGDWTLFGWLDNEQLMIRRYRTGGEEHGVFAVNPFTGENQDLPLSFPDLSTKVPWPGWESHIVFDPTMTRIVYPSFSSEYKAIVWDLISGKEVTRISAPYWLAWSPNGDKLAYLGRNGKYPDAWEEIFILSRDGEISRATYFHEHFDTYGITKPIWSPDSRYLAFWLQTTIDIDYIDRSANLVILDTLTNKLMFYCLQGDPNPGRMPGDDSLYGYQYVQVNTAKPIWSPDSQFLLIENYDLDNRDYKYTYLVSVMNKYWTIKLVENAKPVAWLSSP